MFRGKTPLKWRCRKAMNPTCQANQFDVDTVAQTLLKDLQVMSTALPNKKGTIILLRWVLIIAFSYLLLLDVSGAHVQAHVVLLIAVALSSNLLVARIPEAWAERPLFDFGIVLFDAAWVTLGLVWAPRVSADLFLLYFLVMFVAAMGESLPTIVGSAAVIGLVYGVTLTWHPGGGFRLTTPALLRVPFLFVVSLFYGYFVAEIRSRRSELSEARLREQAKSDLLAAVSHDLRGPLGNAEGLLDRVLEGDTSDAADSRMLLLGAQINIRRVSSLVANLLQAASIEAGRLNLQTRPIQLNDIVDDIFNLEAGAALLRNITLRKQIGADTPLITADPIQMGRIAANLVDNAIKYTAPGGTVVMRTTHDAQSVTLSVEDSGPGMSPEQCQALFAPYRRVHLDGYKSGTGLGLYIVKRLAEAQKGEVKVLSTPGVGSTFVVSFPYQRGSLGVGAPVARSTPAITARRLPRRRGASVVASSEPA
jgi:signal transduction histidine kinase